MHPPIPWEATDAGEIVAEVEPGQWAIIATMSRAVTPSMGQDAARHAVACVNAHPRLVEALRIADQAMRDALVYAGEPYPGSVESDLTAESGEARTLLAEIEKEG